MAHILSACPALAQTKYLARHDAVLKVLFFEIICDLGLIDTVPPWYSPIKPQSVYETAEVQAYWDVPVYRSTKSSEQIEWTLGSLTTERSKW